MHDLVDLSVGSRVEIVEVLPKPGQEPAYLVGHPRHREILIGLTPTRCRVSVARMAETSDRIAGLLTRDLVADRVDLLGAVQQFLGLAVLRFRRRLEVPRVSVRPDSPEDRRRKLTARHPRRICNRYHVTPSLSQMCRGPLYAPTLSENNARRYCGSGPGSRSSTMRCLSSMYRWTLRRRNGSASGC